MRVDGFDNCKKIGDFFWAGDRLSFICPCGCGHLAGIAVGGNPQVRPVWAWNGDREKPTCTPSIRIMPDTLSPNHPLASDYVPCRGWHGYMTDGELRSC